MIVNERENQRERERMCLRYMMADSAGDRVCVRERERESVCV